MTLIYWVQTEIISKNTETSLDASTVVAPETKAETSELMSMMRDLGLSWRRRFKSRSSGW